PIAVANQVNEQIEHLRLDVNDRAGASQLLPRNVDLEIAEAEIQGSPLTIAKAESWSPPSDDLSNSRRLWARWHHTVTGSFATVFRIYGCVADSTTARAVGRAHQRISGKSAGKCRHCVAVLPAHEVLNALDIRVATKRCAVERGGCHLSDQEDTPLKEGNRIAKIRSPRHERIGRRFDAHSSAGRAICPFRHRTPSHRDMEQDPDRCRRSPQARAVRIRIHGVASSLDHVRARRARRWRNAR